MKNTYCILVLVPLLVLVPGSALPDTQAGSPDSSSDKLTIRQLVEFAVRMLDPPVAVMPVIGPGVQPGDQVSEMAEAINTDLDVYEIIALLETPLDDEREAALIELREVELNRILEALSQLALAQPGEALAIAIQATTEYERNRLMMPLLFDWALEDPVAAFDWAQSQGDALVREQAMREVGMSWAQMDAAGFLAFADGLPAQLHSSLLQQTSLSVAYAMAETDPLQVLAWAENLSGEPRQEARLAAYSIWYTQSPEQALANRETMLDPQEQSRFLASIAYDLPAQDIDLANQLFAGDDPTIRMNLSYGLLAEIYKESTTGAQQWVDALPRDEVWTESYLNLVFLITQDQPEDGWRYLYQYSGDNRLQVLEQGIWTIASYSPETVRALQHRVDLDASEQQILADVIEGLDNPEAFHGC